MTEKKTVHGLPSNHLVLAAVLLKLRERDRRERDREGNGEPAEGRREEKEKEMSRMERTMEGGEEWRKRGNHNNGVEWSGEKRSGFGECRRVTVLSTVPCH